MGTYLMLTITLQMLRKLHACEDVISRLQERYGDSFTASNVEALAEAVTYSGSPDWCASNLLRNKDAYEAAIQPHWDAYEAAIQPHWDAYEAAIQPHWDAYWAARQPLWDAYWAARQPLWDAYLAARSLEFAKLYFLENT